MWDSKRESQKDNKNSGWEGGECAWAAAVILLSLALSLFTPNEDADACKCAGFGVAVHRNSTVCIQSCLCMCVHFHVMLDLTFASPTWGFSSVIGQETHCNAIIISFFLRGLHWWIPLPPSPRMPYTANCWRVKQLLVGSICYHGNPMLTDIPFCRLRHGIPFPSTSLIHSFSSSSITTTMYSLTCSQAVECGGGMDEWVSQLWTDYQKGNDIVKWGKRVKLWSWNERWQKNIGGTEREPGVGDKNWSCWVKTVGTNEVCNCEMTYRNDI